MSVLTWVAALVAVWFVASVLVALVVGRYLRRCAAGVAADADEVRPLDTGPLRLWLADLPDRGALLRSGPTVPAPRAGSERDDRVDPVGETTAAAS